MEIVWILYVPGCHVARRWTACSTRWTYWERSPRSLQHSSKSHSFLLLLIYEVLYSFTADYAAVAEPQAPLLKIEFTVLCFGTLPMSSLAVSQTLKDIALLLSIRPVNM